MDKKKHILVISQYFYPEQFRINDMCTEWVKRGYKVTVVTGIPNYPQGDFFDGYDKQHNRTETWNGINIVRLSISPRKTGSVNMAKNYFSFVWSGFWWNLNTKIKADYVFCFEVSPMTQALVAVWYAKKIKVPCYLYVQDLWPENVKIVTGIYNPVVIKPIEAMVSYIYKHCTHIFGTSPSFVKEIQKRCKDNGKVSYWPQYAEEFYVPVDKAEAIASCPEIPNDDSFKVCFTGNIGQAQGLEILPQAAKLLKDENVKFIIVGDGRNRDNFEKAIKENEVEEKFKLVGRHPAEKIPVMLGCCDAAFLSFQKEELWTKTIPAKLQSYMACGMPIIGAAEGETKRVVSEAACGFCSEIGNAEGLAKNIKSMLKMDIAEMSKNSRTYFESHFLKEKLMDEIQEYFN
jgi:glycosyltransferase involved in cell wall biosynthesis